MENLTQNGKKFETIVTLISDALKRQEIRLTIERENFSPRYKTGSLELALQKQVEIEEVHPLNEDGGELPSFKRAHIYIFGLDNQETVQRKLEIANDKLNGTFQEWTPGDVLRNSEKFLDVLDGYFGAGLVLDEQYFADLEAEKNKVVESPEETDSQDNSDEDVDLDVEVDPTETVDGKL